MNNYFEGLYFKHQKAGETLAIIIGKGNDEAFIQVITQDSAYYIPYPVSLYRKSTTITLGENYFSARGIRLSIHEKDISLSGELRYENLISIQGNIMGPFRFLPMQCRHEVVSMNHSVYGSLKLNGHELDFTGGKGYIEGDSGRSFPKSYTWVHSNCFSKSCSIFVSVAHIPFAFSWFWGLICVVWLEGKEYRLATYNGGKIVRRDEEALIVKQKDLTLKITFSGEHKGHILYAPSKGKMSRNIREAPCIPACFEFTKGNSVLFKELTAFASVEHVVE